MSILATSLKFAATRLVPLLVLAFALFFGWLNTKPIPEGTLFTVIFPMAKGYLPPIFSGGFQESPVPPLDSMPNPENDIRIKSYSGAFVRLPGAEVDTGEEQQPRLVTNNWRNMPQQGIGMCCRYTAYDPESVRRTILWYLLLGGRHIDTADLYQNHQWIGEALQIAMHQWNIPREEIWVTTKLWPIHYGSNATIQAIPRMLQELQLDYIDLLLMHQPLLPGYKYRTSECATLGFTPKECRLETWKALSSLRQQGLVHNVGVSNFNARQLQEISMLDGVAPIANNQFQYNPWMPDYAHETFEYCIQNNITVTAWSSFCGSALQHMQAFSVDRLQEIAQNHNATVAQVLLKWAMQKGAVVIPGTANPDHMQENLNALNFDLTDQEMTDIADLRNDDLAKKFFVTSPDDS